MPRKYEVVRLEKRTNDEVLVELMDMSPSETISIQEQSEQPPKTESMVIPENEEEKVIYNQISALKKFLPEFFTKEKLCAYNPPLTIPSYKENTVLYLKREQFEGMNLTIGSIVFLSISISEGDK